ncbi:MAG TPA: hypothetical protein VF768_08240 [Holophagaceae bacterium]
MKRLLYTLAAGVIALGLQAAQPTHGIVGTMHDLSSGGYKTATNATEVCVFCHTPHNASGAANGGQIIPLWNHTTSTATYTMYGGGTATATTLKGASAACLSCHDGTVAVGSLVNTPYGLTMSYASGSNNTQVDKTSGQIVGSHNLGIDLSNDHPINVVYDADMQAITKLQGSGVPLFNAAGDHSWVVGTDTVECASCHDVHNWGGETVNTSYTTGSGSTATTVNGTVTTGAPFLRVANTNSALCTTCHIK